MAYSKTTWVTGDTVTATKLNHAEDGIANAQSTADGAAASVAALGAAGAIGTANLANASVTNAKLDQEAVDTDNIRNGAVTTPLIYDGAVTRAKLADAALADIAAEYSSSATYAIGDYVFHSGALYRCISAITTAEAWTAAHWTQVALGNDVADLKSAISEITGNGIISFTNKKYITLSGSTADITDMRTPTGNCNCAVVPCSAGDKFTIFAKGGAGARAWGFVDGSGNIISVAPSGANCQHVILTAPTDSAYLVINDNNVPPSFSYVGDDLLITKHEKSADDINALEHCAGIEIIELTPAGNGYYIPNNVNVGETVNVNSPSVASGYGYAIVSCVQGDKFTVSGNAGNSARLYSFLDAEYKLLAKADANSSYTYREITAPANSAYLIINSDNHAVKSFRGVAIKNTVDENSMSIAGLRNVFLTKQELTQEYFESLSYNGYLLIDGTVSVSSEWHTSGYIAYSLDYPISYDIVGHYRVASLMFYDKDKEILGYVSASGTQTNVHISGSVRPPKGTKYFRYSVRIDNLFSYETDNITYYVTSVDSEQLLTGKTWNVLGDSITANPAYASARYFERISTRQGGMITRNYGIGGTRIGGTDSNAFCNRYNSMDANADIVTVYGGVNDYGQPDPTPLGEYGDSTNETFYGALKILIEGLITKYPYSLILFMTPIQPNYSSWTVGLEENSLGFTIYDYADAIIKMCGRYGVPVVDLNRTCGFTSRISAEKTKYFYDGLHLNDFGHSKISYLIESSMLLNAKGKIVEPT